MRTIAGGVENEGDCSSCLRFPVGFQLLKPGKRLEAFATQRFQSHQSL
jgi:hypothetical protein